MVLPEKGAEGEEGAVGKERRYFCCYSGCEHNPASTPGAYPFKARWCKLKPMLKAPDDSA